MHIRNILKDTELDAGSTIKEYLTVQNEGSRAGKKPGKFTVF
jgi:hypothetical protein